MTEDHTMKHGIVRHKGEIHKSSLARPLLCSKTNCISLYAPLRHNTLWPLVSRLFT